MHVIIGCMVWDMYKCIIKLVIFNFTLENAGEILYVIFSTDSQYIVKLILFVSMHIDLEFYNCYYLFCHFAITYFVTNYQSVH